MLPARAALTRPLSELRACTTVLSSEHFDEGGRRMTYEQVARCVLGPKLYDAKERAAEAREDAELAVKELTKQKSKFKALHAE